MHRLSPGTKGIRTYALRDKIYFVLSNSAIVIGYKCCYYPSRFHRSPDTFPQVSVPAKLLWVSWQLMLNCPCN